MQLQHRSLYAAYDLFPSRKGAAIHIDRFARTLFDMFGGGALLVLGNPDLPSYQLEGPVEIERFASEVPNFLDRVTAYSDWVGRKLDGQTQLEICHFRDPWSGVPIALRRHRYKVVYEVNALPSIELPTVYPSLPERTLAKIRRLEIECAKAADLVITPSERTKALLADLGVKAMVIPNGADLDDPKPRPADAPARYLLYFGGPQPWQGIDSLLRAFARLADFEDLHLVICASREAKGWRPHERLAEKLGVADKIVWRYALPERELSAWRQHAAISVAPLTDSPRNVIQGCAPLKILESMASGAAVVASDVPPVRELIKDRENGWMVHPERPTELARALRILLDRPDLAREMGQRARQSIADRLTWAHSTDTLRLAYKGVMDESLADLPRARS
ncbi:MAG: glycosyltransferase family 4 protein [Vicinamibacteria bacterium]